MSAPSAWTGPQKPMTKRGLTYLRLPVSLQSIHCLCDGHHIVQIPSHCREPPGGEDAYGRRSPLSAIPDQVNDRTLRTGMADPHTAYVLLDDISVEGPLKAPTENLRSGTSRPLAVRPNGQRKPRTCRCVIDQPVNVGADIRQTNSRASAGRSPQILPSGGHLLLREGDTTRPRLFGSGHSLGRSASPRFKNASSRPQDPMVDKA